MPRQALVYRILIASPSDVAQEREIIPEVIQNWNIDNSIDRGVVLEPVLWETHATPEMGERPQAIINRQLVENSDILIGLFWTRLGTQTGQVESGTVEEIDEFRKAGKPVLLYFSLAPVKPDSIDPDQYSKVQAVKEKYKQEGLVFSYSSVDEFRNLLQRHLTNTIRELHASVSEDADALESAHVDDDIPLPVKEAIAALNSANRDTRREAVNTLARTTHLAALEALIRATEHHIVDVRMNAILKLNDVLQHLRSADIDVVPNVLDLLDHRNKRVRASVVSYLGSSNIRDTRIIPSILNALYDEDKNVRATAARILGEVGDSDVVEELVEVLRDEDVAVRMSVISALEEIGDPYAVPYIAKLLTDNAEDYCKRKVCDKAEEALEKIGTPEALDAVKSWREGREKTE